MTDKAKAAISPVMDILLKIALVAILPWSIWVTVNTFSCKHFMERGSRFTVEDGHRLEKVILEESKKTQELIYLNDRKLTDFEREFSENFVRHSELMQILKAHK